MNHDDVAANTPILVGVGEASERRGEPDYRALSPTALAAQAARSACTDALPAGNLGSRVDAMVAVRTTADSRPPEHRSAASPFGWPANVPGVVARSLGADGAKGFYSPACGDEPQKLVGEFCERLHAGEFKLVVICGAEATSTVRAALAAGESHDWSEDSDAPLEDRGPQTEGMRSRHMGAHKLAAPLQIYPLFEQARRARLGMTREDYRAEIGRLFAPFSEVAADNPHAFSRKRLSAQRIATIDAENRMVADPHTRLMVAREQVNLGAALVLTTVGTARELGIDPAKWVFLHGYSSTVERGVLERQDLGTSPAMRLAYQGALGCAGVGIADIRHIDIYSCFPIAVFAALDALGLAADDPRGLTLTGGLPYFGGPGNNYSMHAIARLAGALRADPGTLGMVGANGGLLSTHAVGIYSTRPRRWAPCDSTPLQDEIDALAAPALNDTPDGTGRVESYTVVHDRDGPRHAIVVGRLDHDDSRFLAISDDGDEATLRAFADDDGLSHRVAVTSDGRINTFTLAPASKAASR